ncbi:terpenoid synthase [Aspergillus sclerotioniger CBS 115572]|uniref:Terpenoid synthase n=1 Tax=Aspergillus sclerotioniger CBS 115572 TaxID=1450535 RepID=A0A317X899_9EURO|nr:terpenoid synthase [Aspergillus sclerotioniger CBS 115572]PWY93882.1 terpenoid synthase [Aspergillus sclerotioniger CBS 115572]
MSESVLVSRIDASDESLTRMQCNAMQCDTIIPRRNDIPLSATYQTATPRPITHAFDPATPPSPPTPTAFSFLHPSNLTHPDYKHTITITPPDLKVPWPTSLPCALQSRYWREAEHAATDYLHTIFSSSHPNTQPEEKYITAISDAAVSYAINLLPLGDLARTKLLTRALVLAFLHDDTADKPNGDRNSHLLIPTPETNTPDPKTTAFTLLSQDILAESPSQGHTLLQGILSWGSTSQHKQPTAFTSLETYIPPALSDFGAGLILRTVEFSLNLPPFSPKEREKIRVLEDLCARHMLLTNDLYSYAKEVIAEAGGGEKVLNAVRVVKESMGVSDELAKRMVRMVIWDLEGRMDGEYIRLERGHGISEAGLRYARAMIVAAAGNMFFSATCGRYARVVEGSKL